MSGWKSNYDREGQSNFDKLAGRQLHVQDNFWKVAKIVLIVFVGVVIYLIINGDVSFEGVVKFSNYLR